MSAEEQWQTSDDRARAAFGPFPTLAAITELQAEGIRRASDIAGRLIHLLDAENTSAPRPPGPGRSDGDGRANVGDLRGAMGRLIDLYGDVLQRTFDSYADLLEERSRRGAHLDGGAGGSVLIEVLVGVDGSVGTGELWLANGTDADTGVLRLFPTPLMGVNGFVAATSVALDPAIVDSVAAGADTRIAVTITVGPGVVLGHYHGYVLVPELPGEALPVTLVVGNAHNVTGPA